MIFSVFDPYSRSYSYYEAPGTSKTYGARGTKYRPLHGHPQGPAPQLGGRGQGIGLIGFAPESLGIVLPQNARAIGRGQEARGVIAVVAPQPAYPARYEESGGTISGYMGGLGATDTTDVVVTPTPVSFGNVVVAACIASVVGVVVQKMLK